MDRALDFGSSGWGFESLGARHFGSFAALSNPAQCRVRAFCLLPRDVACGDRTGAAGPYLDPQGE
jgi:hypothetical protein